jgi:hypothetical protein
MKRMLIAAIAGGLIVFVSAAVAHMATPLGTSGRGGGRCRLEGVGNGSGLYFFPGGDMSVTASYSIWYGFPGAFIAAGLVTEFVAWLLAGFAIARIVSPPVASARRAVAA